jgi:putative transposase
MVRPAQRREVVVWARSAYQLSERKACRAIGVSASFVRYRSRRPDQAPLRRRLRELAGTRVRAGYRQLHIYFRREGWRVNHKRVYRLYTLEGLVLKMKRPRRHRSAAVRVGRAMATRRDEQWAMDFMHDTLAGSTTIRILTVIDLFSRECVALVASRHFSGGQVAEILSSAGRQRGGLPYNGTWPPPERVATHADGPTFLHRCEHCGTFWHFTLRAAVPRGLRSATCQLSGRHAARRASQNDSSYDSG